MFGIIYIVLSLLAGKELAEILCFTGKKCSGSRQQERTAQSFLQSDMGSGGSHFWNGNTGIWMDNVHDLLGGQRSRC